MMDGFGDFASLTDEVCQPGHRGHYNWTYNPRPSNNRIKQLDTSYSYYFQYGVKQIYY